MGKLISKLLSNRLVPMLLELVHPSQSAFIKQIFIQDNFKDGEEAAHEETTFPTVKCGHSLCLRLYCLAIPPGRAAAPWISHGVEQ
jgi:hypothetical protein